MCKYMEDLFDKLIEYRKRQITYFFRLFAVR
nr:MAG TPA_asm: hypothetical protein [Caudoviricetes sp.]